MICQFKKYTNFKAGNDRYFDQIFLRDDSECRVGKEDGTLERVSILRVYQIRYSSMWRPFVNIE